MFILLSSIAGGRSLANVIPRNSLRTVSPCLDSLFVMPVALKPVSCCPS
jgi:hypothetical protein